MSNLQVAQGWKDYRLVDSGGGEKLESWGGYVMIRPEPRALWSKKKAEDWRQPDAVFRSEKWEILTQPPKPWIIEYQFRSLGYRVKFVLRTSEFRHTGVFPEQASNWEWIRRQVSEADKQTQIRVLNLFGYTGGATMAAVGSNTHITHVDASRPAMMWASENVSTSGIAKEKIRWIQDDVLKFVQREQRRGVFYDAIIMDPPRFGRGANGEVWKLEENLAKLVHECKKILSPNPLFFLINAYTADLSHLAVKYVLEDALGDLRLDKEIESGELGIPETNSDRVLPAGIYARWSKSESGKR